MSTDGASLGQDIVDITRSGGVQVVPVTCVALSPFQVCIAGGTSWVPAKRIAGQTFAVGDKGMAFWSIPLAPICFRTE